jgi:hypothetical protein
MKTIELDADVTTEGTLTLNIKLPPNIQPGKHRVVVIIEEAPVKSDAPTTESRPAFTFKALELPAYPPDYTFSREDIYDDDGR